MFAVLAEDDSDAEALVVLVKRIVGRSNQPILKRGFQGCGELRRKAWSHIKQFSERGATRFIICHDADERTPEDVRRDVLHSIRQKLDVDRYHHVVVVPVQELEAWIIADAMAVASVIPSFRFSDESQPEQIRNPKEWLEKKSESAKNRPKFIPNIHNEKVMAYLDIAKVESKCPSFRELTHFVREQHPPS